MQIIAPTYITDSTLISCDIPAASASYPEWDDTVSYITGQRVSVNYLIDGITPGVHIIYECTWHGAGNIDMYPPDHLNMESGYYWWTRISATERWKLFDMIVAPDRANASANVVGCDWESGVIWESGTTWATDTYASMQVTVQPGLIDTVALMNLDASTVSIIMDDPSAGEVYNETDTPSTSTYYNSIFEDLPAYPNATTQLIIRNYSGDVNVGEAIFGAIKTLGKVRPGVNVGLVDYSQKQVDAFGGFSILERAFSKRLDCNVMISTANHSGVMRVLEKYRSTPLVWIISANYSTTLIYGYYRDFKISIPNLQIADCSLSIEGLGGDMVNATPIPDPWVDPWDGSIDLVVPIPTISVSTSKIEETPVAIGPGQLLLTFEGADAATTWPELAQGLTIDYNIDCVLDDAQKYSGITSLLIPLNGEFGYVVPNLSNDFTCIHRFRYHGMDDQSLYPLCIVGTSSIPEFSLGFESSQWYIKVKDSAGTFIANMDVLPTPTVDTWITYKVVTSGRNISLYIDDTLFDTWTAAIDNPWLGMNYSWFGNYNTTAGYDFWLDLVEWKNAPAPEAIMPKLTVPDVPTIAITTGVYLWIGNCTISQAEPCIVTCATHGLVDDDPIFFQTDGTLPLPIVAGDYQTNIYYVDKIDNDTFNIKYGIGGYQVDTTTAGSGTHKLMNATPS
jgi:hypothetical protein